MEVSWQSLKEEPPDSIGFYWIYMSDIKIGNGIFLAFYENKVFYDESMNEWGQESISHWCKANRPEPPAPNKKT